jgi:hypothetical protein
MKAIDVGKTNPTLTEVLELATSENLVLKLADGRAFVVAEIDDFDQELARVRENENLMKLLDERSNEKVKYTLADVRKRLKVK